MRTPLQESTTVQSKLLQYSSSTYAYPRIYLTSFAQINPLRRLIKTVIVCQGRDNGHEEAVC